MSDSGVEAAPARQADGPWDPLILWLQRLRDEADSPSYAEIAQAVARGRQDAGMRPEAATVARSSVYDMFRPGRRRLNLSLVREVATVLGASESDVAEQVRRCREASASDVPAEARPPVEEPEALPTGGGVRLVIVLMLACVGLNLLGRVFVDALHVPLFADMIGTAIAAIALGPWRGAAVGAATNVLGVVGSGGVSLAFAVVNVVGALVWGYGVRRFAMARTLPRFLVLNLIAAVVCSIVAITVIFGILGGVSGHGADAVAERATDLTGSVVLGVAASNLTFSTADKLLSGFVALVVVGSVAPVRALMRSSDLPFVVNPVKAGH